MNKIFDPVTFKLFDFSSGQNLNYHVNHAQHPDCYDPICETTYQIAPSQLLVGKVNVSITAPSILNSILETIDDRVAFSSGYAIGFSDGFFTGTRKAFVNPQSVTWSFLVSYEYGVQLGAFYRQYK